MRKKETVKKEKKATLENQLRTQEIMIRSAGKEIYENINQCLCLARLQLGSLDPENREKVTSVIGEASLLIGKAVQDLRNLAKQFSLPDSYYKHD